MMSGETMKSKIFDFKDVKNNFICKKYDLYKDSISKKNIYNVRRLLEVGITISVILVIVQFFTNTLIPYNWLNLLMIVYYVLLIILTKPLEKHRKLVIPFIYIGLLPILAVLIAAGFMVPDKPAVTMLVTIAMLPCFIIDKPWRMSVYLVSLSLVMLVCELFGKTREMFIYDAKNIGFVLLFIVLADIIVTTERIENFENMARLRNKSENDYLTNLYNRGAGIKKIEKLINSKNYGMFCIIDIDNFKMINDTYGHNCGDDVLVELSATLQNSFTGQDIIMRMGGDEFAIYAVEICDEFTCKVMLDNLYRKLRKIKVSPMKNGEITISMGIAFNSECEKKSYKELYLQSDTSLYEAKEQGKDRYIINEKPA